MGSGSAVTVKLLGQPGHHVVIMEIVLIRGVVCVLLSLLVGATKGMDKLSSQRRNWPALAVRGISGSVSIALEYVSVQYLPLADAVSSARQALHLSSKIRLILLFTMHARHKRVAPVRTAIYWALNQCSADHPLFLQCSAHSFAGVGASGGAAGAQGYGRHCV